MTNFNSAPYWFPKIKEAGLPVPRTEFVPIEDYGAVLGIFDSPETEDATVAAFRKLWQDVGQAAAKIGYPVFIRTDIGSAKHDGPKAYFASSESDLPGVIAGLLEHHEMTNWLGPSPEAIMVREFLELDAPFTAFGGLPIAREWRFFANSGQRICHHPYWPEGAIKFWANPPMEDWKEQLAELNAPLIPELRDVLGRQAVAAAWACAENLSCQPGPMNDRDREILGRAWSVDFARDRTGKWWLLDMALRKDSWHCPGCPFGPEDRKEMKPDDEDLT